MFERHRDRMVAGVGRVVADGAGAAGNRPGNRVAWTAIETTDVVDDERARVENALASRDRAACRRVGVLPGAEQGEYRRVQTARRSGAGAWHHRKDVQRIVDADAERLRDQRPRAAARPVCPQAAGGVIVRCAVNRPSSKSTIAFSCANAGAAPCA